MTIRVEVAYARPERQVIVEVEIDEGTTLIEAVVKSGIHRTFPEIDPEKAATGIFGQPMPGTHILREGDRVEIYRPLMEDPRIARRARSKGGA